jgi:hypothetical protein
VHKCKPLEVGKALVATEIGVNRDPATVAAIMGRVGKCAGSCRSLRGRAVQAALIKPTLKVPGSERL